MDQGVSRNRSILERYIPLEAVPLVIDWIYRYDFKLKIKRSRDSREGDYTPPRKGKNHVITVNRDLNPYSFLVTLTHEVAHLVAWTRVGNKQNPHGEEWKQQYRNLLAALISFSDSSDNKFLPDKLKKALIVHSKDPSASSCSDPHLFRVLHTFDAVPLVRLLEDLPAGSRFRILSKKRSEVFVKEEKIRTRYKCRSLGEGDTYFVPALCKVMQEE